MFEVLTGKINQIFANITNRGILTEKDVLSSLREVRVALLEADVNFRVVKDFIAKIQERAIGREILETLNPGQQVVKIVKEEMTNILSAGDHSIKRQETDPSVLMLVGLQGTGKTTTAAKLALHFSRQNQSSLLVAGDLRRPAAIEQLIALGDQIDIPVYSETAKNVAPVDVIENSLREAKSIGAKWVIIDTAGRLNIDDNLMSELSEIRSRISPIETILVVDGMAGQDAVNAAQLFHEHVVLTGLIMTKLDGNSKGGAALSISKVTGVPIKFTGIGEKVDALEVFHPDRMASRILGMGDVLTLIEKGERVFRKGQALELQKKIRKAEFDLGDFLEQMKGLEKMGSIESLMEMMPGLSGIKRKLAQESVNTGSIKKIQAIIQSMTFYERRNPKVINGSRRKRIALGSGTEPTDVNHLMNQFTQTQKMMKMFSKGKGAKSLLRMFG
jgi:signal recognition particle subunit SRP54